MAENTSRNGYFVCCHDSNVDSPGSFVFVFLQGFYLMMVSSMLKMRWNGHISKSESDERETEASETRSPLAVASWDHAFCRRHHRLFCLCQREVM